MIKKWLSVGFIVLLMMTVMPVSSAFARHGAKCGYCPHTSSSAWHQMDIKDKFFWKAHYILENQTELELTEDQVKAIKQLKLDAKKNWIKQNAEIEVFAIDLNAGLWEDPVNLEQMNLLIDQKYEIKRALAKSFLEAYAKLKATLTPEQKAKLKELWKKK